ncbi:MAG: hypothetical protein ACP5VR_01590 [Acidimicrobiales bacterium]
MGGGNPAIWPAAKPYPPSLAGAYGTNLKKAFLSLLQYMDWAFAHPDPSLVANAVVPQANIYTEWVRVMEALVKRGWHECPKPTDIEFLKVVKTATASHRFLDGTVDAVINGARAPYLNANDQVVAYQSGQRPYAISVVLGRATATERFRIARWYVLHPAGGLAAWERELREAS